MFNALFWAFGFGSIWLAILLLISAFDGFVPILGVPTWAIFLSMVVQAAVCMLSAKMAERNGEWL